MLKRHQAVPMVRHALSLFAAGFIGLAATTAPVSADAAPSAGGSCGPAPGVYGRTGVGAEEFGSPGNSVPAVYYQINYNVVSPTQIGVLLRYNDELGTAFLLTVFPSQGTGGSFENVWRADIRPENSGWNNSLAQGSGRADGPVTSQRSRGGVGQTYYATGGLQPGGWHFYVYTGEVRYNDARGYHFVADEAGFLGKFACNVADNDSKN